MLSIAICDDSTIDIANITDCIVKAESTLGTKFLVSSYTDADTFIKEVVKGRKKADVVFLDIYIKNKNGYDIAKEIRRYDSVCKIIFFTSSISFAVQSYSVNAFNYIVKPAKPDMIADILRECLEFYKRESGRHILIKQRGSVFSVLLSSVLFVESRGRQLYVHTTSHGEINYYQKLDELEESIAQNIFLRCHQSYLVNMDYINSVEDNYFILINGQEVPIRKVNMQEIKNVFFAYISREL